MVTAVRPTPTKGYEITMFEIKQFCRACGLNPPDVLSLHIADKRVVATVPNPPGSFASTREIVIPITETRAKK
jgi:hypothetical protein